VGAAVTGAAPLAAVVALSYLAFAGFVVVALVRDVPIGSCGCFGKVDTPPSLLHVVLDLGLAVAAAAVTVGGADAGLVDGLGHLPLAGMPFLLLVATGAYAAFALMTVVPQLARLERSR
jgi:hypothetical protein